MISEDAMALEMDPQAWAQKLFGQCELADIRLTRRLVRTMSHLARNGGGTISRACASDVAALQGGYRLLRNSQVSVAAMSDAGFAATIGQIRPGRTMLALEDSSVLSYSHAVAEELGDTGGKAGTPSSGLWSHNTLLVDAKAGMTLGLIAQTLWCRDKGQRGKKHLRRQKRPQEKESAKWSRHAQQMRERLGHHLREVITVSDRESDVFAYLWDKHQHRERFIVRAAQDRALLESEGRLVETLNSARKAGQMQVQVPQRGGRPARTAQLSLRAQAIELVAPAREGIDADASVPVNAILAQEESAEGATRLCWVLLSSEPIDTPEQIEQALRYYVMRWRIEEFHKAWKSGAQVEAMRMQSKAALQRMIVMLAFVGVRLLQLREALENTQIAQRPCTGVLSEVEWRVLWIDTHQGGKAVPRTAPTLRWAYEALARLGGFYDSKRTGRASWATMYEGWKRLQDHVALVNALGKTP
jgi:hypothetical protein